MLAVELQRHTIPLITLSGIVSDEMGRHRYWITIMYLHHNVRFTIRINIQCLHFYKSQCNNIVNIEFRAVEF